MGDPQVRICTKMLKIQNTGWMQNFLPERNRNRNAFRFRNIRIRNLNADPDPATQINADPDRDPKPWWRAPFLTGTSLPFEHFCWLDVYFLHLSISKSWGGGGGGGNGRLITGQNRPFVHLFLF